MDIAFGKFTRKKKDEKKEPGYRSTNEGQKKDISLRIVFVGEICTGAKTCFITRYARGVFDDRTSATIGAAFLVKNVNLRGKTVKMDIWDTNGMERTFSLIPIYTRGAAGVVMGYDITSRESLNTARQRMIDLKRIHSGEKKVYMLIGNKADLESERQVSYEEGEELARELDIPLFFETSAKTGYNVNESMDALINMILDMNEQ